MRKLCRKQRTLLFALLSTFVLLLLLLSVANCNAQVSCNSPYGFAYDPTTYWYTPNITSVSPSTWEAGKTYNISIAGTGLVDVPNPNRDPQTPTTSNGEGNCTLGVTLTKSGSVTVSNVSFVSATLVTATVTLDASDSTQTACVTVGGVVAMGVMQPADTDACPANAAQTATAAVQIVNAPSAIITDTSDIMNGNVTVKLTAPSGTTGDLNLIFNGSDASGQELSQIPFTALSPGSQDLKLTFDTILPGIYPMANGSWNAMLPAASTAQSVNVPDYTLPTQWTYFRKIFYTQYNVPHESACSGGDEEAWLVSTTVVKGKTTCSFKKIKLNTQFIAATWMNGTGIDLDGDMLKNAASVKLGDLQTCAGQYPSGAIGDGEDGGNTFTIVDSVSGSCPGRTLVADQSLAIPARKIGKQYVPTVLSNVKALSCGDQLNLDNGDYTTASMRTADDKCPKCSQASTFKGADGHIDAFSSNQSCTGGAVGDLGFFYTSYPTN